MNKRTFLYQPSPLSTIICWSWTLSLLLLGLVFWLEVTHFQWITLFFFILAGFLIFVESFFRRLVVENGTLTIHRVMNPQWAQLSIQKITPEIKSRHRLRLSYNHHSYDFLLSVNSVIELNDIINSYQKILHNKK